MGMRPKFGILIVMLGLTLPAMAAGTPGVISGYVRSANGVPQMGAIVEVLSSSASTLRILTDDHGF